ncbi:MAG: hypothetical protein AAGA88_05210 [Pseudomonadota bacterium]
MAMMIAGGYLLYEKVAHTASLVFETEGDAIPALVRRTYGPHDVLIPGEWLTRKTEQRSDPNMISVRLPYRTVLAETETPSLEADHPWNDSRIGILIHRPSTTVPQAELLSSVYIPNTIPRSIDVAGLEARAFNDHSGYDGETLYIGRDAGRTFIARCADTGRKSLRYACLHIVQVSNDLEFAVQFPTSLLGDWRRFDVAVDRLIRGMLAS